MLFFLHSDLIRSYFDVIVARWLRIHGSHIPSTHSDWAFLSIHSWIWKAEREKWWMRGDQHQHSGYQSIDHNHRFSRKTRKHNNWPSPKLIRDAHIQLTYITFTWCLHQYTFHFFFSKTEFHRSIQSTRSSGCWRITKTNNKLMMAMIADLWIRVAD